MACILADTNELLKAGYICKNGNFALGSDKF